MKVEITKRQVLMMEQSLKSARLTGPRFTYAVTMNKEAIAAQVKAIRAALEPTKEHKKYLDELEELNVKMCKKDEDDKPIKIPIGGNQVMYDIPGYENPDSAYEKAVKKLQVKHKKAIDDTEAKRKENDKFVEEKVSVDLVMVQLDNVPDDVPQGVMDGIVHMIKKPKEEE